MSKLNLDVFDKAVKDLSAFDAENEAGYSQLESAGLGAVQGATFGFADEAEAALRSAVQDKSYDEIIEEARQRYKMAEEENPISFMAGNVAGGVALPAGFLGTSAKAGASLANLIKAGAIGGGLTSLGTTEQDKLSLQSAADVAQGAAIGGTLGAGMHAAGKGISTVGKSLKNTEMIQDAIEQFKRYQTAPEKAFPSMQEHEALSLGLRSESGNLINTLKELGQEQRNIYGNVIKNIEKQNKDIAIDKVVSDLRNEMFEKTYKEEDTANKLLSKLLGEETVTVEKIANLDPATELARAQTKMAPMVAKGEMTARGTASRMSLKQTMKEAFEEQGYDAKTAERMADDLMMRDKTAVENIDLMEKAIVEGEELAPSRFPAEVKKDPTTGLDVLQARRPDADLNIAMPTQKLEKVKEVIPTRTSITPTQIVDYRNQAQKLFDQTQDPIFLRIKQELGEALKSGNKAQLDKVFKQLNEMREIQSKAAGKLQLDMSAIDTTDAGRSLETKEINRLQNLLQRYHEDKSSPDVQSLDEFFKTLKQSTFRDTPLTSSDLAKVNELGQKVPGTIEDLQKNIMEKAKEFDIVQKSLAKSSLESGATWMNPLRKLGLSAGAVKLWGAAAAGKTTGSAQKAFNNTMHVMYNSTPEQLIQMANSVKDSGLSNILRKAATAPQAKRKALLFTLMQQPTYRQMLEGDDSGE